MPMSGTRGDRRVRWGVAALACAAALLASLGLWRKPPADDTPAVTGFGAERQPVRPAASRRARAARPQTWSPPPSEQTAAADGVTDVERIEVALGDVTSRSRQVVSIPFFGPGRFWPDGGEAPFPESEAVDALQALLDLDASGENRELRSAAEERFLDAAQHEGLSVRSELPGDPWLALVALEAERARNDRRFVETLREARDRDDQDTYQTVGKDLTALASAAGQLVDTYPDEAVGDFARLYQMYALGEDLANTYDPALAREVALGILGQTADSLVAESAGQLLSGLPPTASLAPEELDDVLAGIEGQYDARARTALAQWGLDQAFELGDWERAGRWLEQLEAVVEAQCSVAEQPELCSAWRREILAARGQIAAVAGTDGGGWRAELVAAVWRCHLDEPFDGPVTQGVGRWDDGWSWGRWEPEGGHFTTCVEREVHAGPGPLDPRAVELLITTSSRVDLF